MGEAWDLLSRRSSNDELLFGADDQTNEPATLQSDGLAIIEAMPSRGTLTAILDAWHQRRCVVLIDAVAPPERRRALARIALDCGSLSDPNQRFAAAIFTSGSGGTPKLAVHCAESLVAAARSANARVPFCAGDRWLLSLSPHHIGGLAILVRALVDGGAVEIGGGPRTVANDLIALGRVTHVSLVGAQLRSFLDAPISQERLGTMRAVLLGGGPAPAVWRQEAVLAGIPLLATYGMTECASQITTGKATVSDEAGDAGRPLDGIDVRIGEGNEILVRGPTVFAGYVEGPVIRDARNAEGWFATGDTGRIDARGNLLVHGRRDAMFVSGGENVQPEEIENALREVAGISQACVIGVDHPKWQKRPVAFVVGTFAVDDLMRVLALRLERFRWPDHIYAMPQDLSQRMKPSRAELERRVADSKPLWSR